VKLPGGIVPLQTPLEAEHAAALPPGAHSSISVNSKHQHQSHSISVINSTNYHTALYLALQSYITSCHFHAHKTTTGSNKKAMLSKEPHVRRCHCKFRYISNFTTASCSFPIIAQLSCRSLPAMNRSSESYKYWNEPVRSHIKCRHDSQSLSSICHHYSPPA